jgi:hypothetical protein
VITNYTIEPSFDDNETPISDHQALADSTFRFIFLDWTEAAAAHSRLAFTFEMQLEK